MGNLTQVKPGQRPLCRRQRSEQPRMTASDVSRYLVSEEARSGMMFPGRG